MVRLFLFILLFSVSSFAHEVPAQRLAILTKGVNLPHWYWRRDRQALLDHYINDRDIEILTKLGVRHVRIPFEMGDLNKPRILEQFKKDIKKFMDHKIGVIVSAFGHAYNRDLISSIEGIEELQRLCFILKETSPNYVFLQIANEPFLDDPKNWSSLQDTLLQAARQILPHHTLMTSTPLKFDRGLEHWNMIKAFCAMVPSEDRNVVYAFHFYEPYLFTHQSADWDSNTRFIKNLEYPTTHTNAEKVISELPKTTPLWIIQSLSGVWDKSKLREALAPILEWREKYQRPVMVTEFGVYKVGADTHSRLRWLEDVIDLFNKAKLPWTYWDYDAGFGLFTIRQGFRALDRESAKILGFTIPDCKERRKLLSEKK